MNKYTETPAIEVHDLTFSYGELPVLWNVNLELPSGQLIGVIGPNGGGKTTLVKIMAGVITPASGYVRFYGKSLKHVRKRIAYVPQRQSIDWDFPLLVREVVMMGRYLHMGLLKRPSSQDKRVVKDCLEQVGLSHLAERHIGALSGGQQQRVFVARALAQQADIFLLDEPFAGIDANTESLVLTILKNLAKAGKTIVLVHHTLQSVVRYCSYTVLLNLYVKGAGATKEVLTPNLLKDTYGSRLTLLSEVGHLLYQENFPIRDP